MDPQVNERVEYIINNLLPATGLEGKFGPPQRLADRMAHYHTPGVSIAVINNFALEWAQGFGLRDARYKPAVTTETLFQAASISKAIFALGVMRLVEAGRLNLDEDIQRYLTSWRVPAKEGWQPHVTLRQLLSHTAGFTVHGFPGYPTAKPLPTVTQILNGEAPTNTAKVEVNLLPSTQFRYSGGGTTVAQQVLVDVLGQPFPQMMHELVFAPLGLTNSTYAQPLPKTWVKRAATAHPWNGQPQTGRFHVYPEMAAAGLWTTPSDLAKVGVELLQTLHTPKTPALLSPETLATMLHPQLAQQQAGDGEFVGLGFFCNGKEDGFYFGHDGWNHGFLSEMRFYKQLGKGAVVMINSNEGYPLLHEIRRALAQAYAWPEALPKAKTPVSLANVQDYVGRYATEAGMQFRVSIREAGLVLQYGSQPPLPIFPASDSEFFTNALNLNLGFEKEAQAGIVALTLRQAGHQLKAQRQAST